MSRGQGRSPRRRAGAVFVALAAPLGALLLAACAAAPGGREALVFDLDGGWRIGDFKEVPSTYGITEFVREGDAIGYWRELVTVQNFSGAPQESPEKALERLRIVHDRDCPGASEWSVISGDAASILYEWRSRPCLGYPSLHEVARIVDGRRSRFRIAYTKRAPEMSAEERARWIAWAAKAGVVTDAR